MDKSRRYVGGFAACAALLWAGTVVALPPPETSLNTCQKTVGVEGRKFVQNTVKAVGNCLKAVANDKIKKNGDISAGTLSTCVTQFRKINDGRAPALNRSFKQKLNGSIDAKCVPGFTPNQTHVIDDITDDGPGLVSEKIETENIDLWCKHFGGDGSIDSVPEWEDCITTSHNCEAAAAILAQFPRALEWIDELQDPGNMDSVPEPSTDTTRDEDAIAGAVLFETLLDPDGDGVASPHCGGDAVLCSTACCYVEQVPGPVAPETSCFEYTGPAAGTATFMASCGPGLSMPGGPFPQLRTPLPGPCGVGPNFFQPCVVASPAGNKVVLPTDPLCP